MALIKSAEAQIDPKYWMHIPAADQAKYVVLLRESRIALTQDGIYDKKMMAVLKKIRCKNNPTDSECSQNLE